MKSLHSFFTGLSDDFISGDFAAVIERFDFPMAIYKEGEVIVCSTPARLVAAFEQYHRLLVSNGARSATVNILAVPLMRGTTGTIWIEKTYHDADGAIVDSAQLKYFFRARFGTPRISMMEYLHAPSAAMASNFPAVTAAC